MKKTTKAAIIAHHEAQLAYFDVMIDLNIHNPEAVKEFQKQYRQVAKILAELLATKAADE